MNFLADESVDQPIVLHLRKEGHNVAAVSEMDPGISDEDVLEQARKHQSILITSDKDFGELVFRKKLLSNGVVLIRLSGLTSTRKAQLVSSVLLEYASRLRTAFTVISSGHIRIRKQM